MLDTARLRDIIGREIDIDPKSVYANVIGEHGDSEVVLWSDAKVGSQPIAEWELWNQNLEEEVTLKVRKAAQEIIKRKGATNHAIGLVTATLLKWLLRGDKIITTVSSVIHGAYGLSRVALSLPTLIGENGIQKIIPITISDKELAGLHNSAEVLKDAILSVSEEVD